MGRARWGLHLFVLLFVINLSLAADSSSTRPGKFRKKSNAAEREAVREQEKKETDSQGAHKQAYDDAFSAISECSVIHKAQSPAGLEERVVSYKKFKQSALTTLPKITQDDLTTSMTVSGESTELTKSIGDWFAFCDKTMTEKIANISAKVKADASNEEADSKKRKEMNDRIRREQEAKFKALVAASKGDRKRILESKGYLPSWPRSGDLKTAPVWKWEINITQQAIRCEMFQFAGLKLKSTTTDLGACP
ncbi:MAG: hypothetical protein A2X86_13615 [Bdellovibrionales bacterium GWA2_49_15]|nr:MAG: hypothetical protein A2X86_13615 [Bdellovibrionales bacterium GWA2_49_15]HAZ13564.1 hypothetical protein [Bdellovibrionales bacterium]